MAAIFSLRPNVPKRLIDTDKLNAGLERALDTAAKAGLRELKSITRTWDHKPMFTVQATRFTRTIRTSDRIFNIVDQGAKPHTIKAKNPSVGFLQFQRGYHPKTAPRILDSQRGGSFGPFVRKKVVHHPGFEGRDFSGAMADYMQKELEKQVEEQMRKALGG